MITVRSLTQIAKLISQKVLKSLAQIGSYVNETTKDRLNLNIEYLTKIGTRFSDKPKLTDDLRTTDARATAVALLRNCKRKGKKREQPIFLFFFGGGGGTYVWEAGG